MSAPPAPPPPPPPPPPPGWKPNWREERAKEENKEEKPASQPIKIPNSGPQSPKPPVGSGPDGSFTQYDRLPEKLQSTLSKDKKPFTYTPAGIDLSEIKSPKFQKKVNRAKQLGDYSSVGGPGSPELNEYGQQAPLWPDDIQDITEYCNNPAELDESMTNPRYTGSKIPSRSFKVLQAITATSDDECPSPAFSPRGSTQSAPAPPPPPPEFSTPSSYGPSSTPLSDYSFAPETSLYTQPTPTYRKVPPPVPPKPPRGIPRECPMSPLSISTPAAPLSPPPSYTPRSYAPPVQQPPIFTPSSFAPPVPPSPVYTPSTSVPPVPPSPAYTPNNSVPPVPPLPFATSSFEPPPVPPPPSFASRPANDAQNRQPFSESFYRSTVNPVFKTYTPPPSVRQTVRSGPGFRETTTHKSGPGYEETTTYSSYSTPSYSDGTQTLPLRRESKRSTTKSSFKSQPYYDSPYQTLLDSPQFRDPFSFGGLTPSYSNPYTDQFKYGRSEPLSAPIRNQPFFSSGPASFSQSNSQPLTRQSTTSTSYQKTSRTSGEDRPLSMTSKFFDEINQMFDQTSANISREMYGTDF